MMYFRRDQFICEILLELGTIVPNMSSVFRLTRQTTAEVNPMSILDELMERKYQEERHANVDPVFRTILKEVSSDT